MAMRTKVIIMGAAGRDFHNFNVFFRDNDNYEVVAFTAAQIPEIAGRTYPPELAGTLYPQGIPIEQEGALPELIKRHSVDEVVFAYSDLPHEEVMHKASLVLASGADFRLMGSASTMLSSRKPVIAVCAVRTGCGKSQTTRKVCNILRKKGRKVVVVRHPMAYGNLEKQVLQRFAEYDDLDVHKCTIEEREEFEPYIERGIVVYAGVDYARILREAEAEADIIVWDGGNNDIPFYKPDLHIVIADPHRAGHESTYHPGETNIRMADVIIINKELTAEKNDIERVRANVTAMNPEATIIDAASPFTVEDEGLIRDKIVLVVEDGPTLTHGNMEYGAGTIAARQCGAGKIADPRPYAVGSIKSTFKKYTHLGNVLPAMGYGETQMRELQETINAVPCDVVISGTPIDLSRVLKVNKPIVRIMYELQELSKPDLEDVLSSF